jgi:hypothetical protein
LTKISIKTATFIKKRTNQKRLIKISIKRIASIKKWTKVNEVKTIEKDNHQNDNLHQKKKNEGNDKQLTKQASKRQHLSKKGKQTTV